MHLLITANFQESVSLVSRYKRLEALLMSSLHLLWLQGALHRAFQEQKAFHRRQFGICHDILLPVRRLRLRLQISQDQRAKSIQDGTEL
jgi:hypothetical protein